MTYQQYAKCGFDQEIAEYSYSLLRFSSNEENGLNPSQTLQYFFPKRSEATNSANHQLYKKSQFMYMYSPTSPLHIVNVKIFTANHANLLELHLPEKTRKYFAYNENREIVRTQASDAHMVDNQFYAFILEKVDQIYEQVDGVYMPSHDTAHEEVVLRQSGVDKLKVIEIRQIRANVKTKRAQVIANSRNKRTNITKGRTLNFEECYIIKDP
jgi:hypothetical protein